MLLGIAFLILYAEHGTGYIDRIFNQYPLPQLSLQLHIAALLIANVVLIKCAQLPLHGWLVQVVESPTPVSALLHAGIINLGGLLLLMFAPLFSVFTCPSARFGCCLPICCLCIFGDDDDYQH